jgi:hypothetical protein
MEDSAHYGLLQDSKTQLDFLVSMFWLIVLSLAAWTVYEGLYGTSPTVVLTIAIGGALALVVLYRLALETYGTFVDLLRASVDLYRFDLLEALHLALPDNAHHERALWPAVERQLGYAEAQTMNFKHTS